MKRALLLATLSLALLPVGACKLDPPKTMTTITRYEFGQLDDEIVYAWILVNRRGAGVRITNWGATVLNLQVPDRNGDFADVVLGFDTLEEYLEQSPYFGSTVGRCANRIAGAEFELDGVRYTLAANDPPNHLHGGLRGFDKVIWRGGQFEDRDGAGLRFTYDSPDGEEGYPGNVHAEVVYRLTEKSELVIEMTATTDRATPVNLVHHTYWNLSGHDSGDVLGHRLQIEAERYTPTDETLIPTGAIEPVAGTAYDFTSPVTIGRDIDQVGGDPGGYDVNYVVDEGRGLRPVARVHDPASGRALVVESNQPGLQFYSGNFLDGLAGKKGAIYQKHAAFCLESQVFPDAIHREGSPGWPSVVLRPGETYRHVMVHRFGVLEE